jgi:hypothetical protein
MLEDFTASELHTATPVLDRLTEIFQRIGHGNERCRATRQETAVASGRKAGRHALALAHGEAAL